MAGASDDDLFGEYISSLNDLTFNSKPLINTLTLLAEDYIKVSHLIAKAIEEKIHKAPSNQKLSSLYLVDSIIKNLPKSGYRELFSKNIVKMFCQVFEQADEKTRQSMYKLRQTWTDIFPNDKLYAIDVKVKTLDPAWPITSVSPVTPTIHVNPRFMPPGGAPGSDSEQSSVKSLGEESAPRKASLEELKQMEKQLEETKKVIERHKQETQPPPTAQTTAPPQETRLSSDPPRDPRTYRPNAVQPAKPDLPPAPAPAPQVAQPEPAKRPSEQEESSRVRGSPESRAPTEKDQNLPRARDDSRDRNGQKRIRGRGDSRHSNEPKRKNSEDREGSRPSRRERKRRKNRRGSREPSVGDSSKKKRSDDIDSPHGNMGRGAEGMGFVAKSNDVDMRMDDMRDHDYRLNGFGFDNQDQDYRLPMTGQSTGARGLDPRSFVANPVVDAEAQADRDRFYSSLSSWTDSYSQRSSNNQPDSNYILMVDDKPYQLKPNIPRNIKVGGSSCQVIANTASREVRADDKVVFRMCKPTFNTRLHGRSHKFCYFGKPISVWIDSFPYEFRGDAPPKTIYISHAAYPITVNSYSGQLTCNDAPLVNVNDPPQRVRMGRTDATPHEIRFTQPEKTIMIDGLNRKMRYDLPLPCVQVGSKMYGIRFYGPPQEIHINNQPYVVPFEQPIPVHMGRRRHVVGWGGPGFEVIIDGKSYEVHFNEAPREIFIGMKPYWIAIKGELPAVELLDELDFTTDRPSRPLSDPFAAILGNRSPGVRLLSELQSPVRPIPSLFSVPTEVKPAGASVNVHELFGKLLHMGIIQEKPGSAPANPAVADTGAPREQQQRERRPPRMDSEPGRRRVNFDAIPDMTAFNKEHLIRHHDIVIAHLYSGDQCSSCGTRFVSQDHIYKQHLDWHFRKTKREEEAVNQARSRPWFMSLLDWIQYEEILDEEPSENPFAEEQPASATYPALLGLENVVDRPIAGESDDVCEICKEPFEQYWDEEEEEWHLENAIRVGEKTYHPVCYQDVREPSQSALASAAEEQAASDAVFQEETTPEPQPEMADPLQEMVEPSQEMVDPMQEMVEPKQEMVEPQQEEVEPMQEVVEPMHEVIEPQQEVIEPMQEEVEPMHEVIEPKQEAVEPQLEAIEPMHEVVELALKEEESQPISESSPPVLAPINPFETEERPDVSESACDVQVKLEPVEPQAQHSSPEETPAADEAPIAVDPEPS